jgi:hypothetical protein
VGSAFVDCADSATTGCTSGKPCCDIQTALNKATNVGDVVEIHAGTYDGDKSWTTTTIVSSAGGSINYSTLAVIKPSSASQETDRRYVRGACKKATAGGDYGDPSCAPNDHLDMPILAASTTGGVNLALSLGETNSDHCDFVTIQDIEITGFDEVGSTGWFPIGIGVRAYATDLIIDRVNIHDMDTDTTGNLNCECGSGAIGMHGKFGVGLSGTSDRTIIRNSTLDAVLPLAFDSGSSVTTWPNDAMAQGIDVHNNTMVVRASSTYTSKWTIKGVHNLVLRNNVIRQLGPIKPGLRFRQDGNMWIFNNYFQDWRNTDWQDTKSPADVYIFNNTYVMETYESGGVVRPPSTTPPSIRFYNNAVFRRAQTGTSRIFDCFGNGANLSVGHIHWNVDGFQNSCESLGRDDGSHVCTDAQTCGSNSAYTECSGSGGCEAATPGWHSAGDKPYPYYSLVGTSILKDTGTNDPEGGGDGGTCSFSPWAGYPIDCATDYDGDARGSTWDIGADETVGLGSIGPPPGFRRGES